MSEDEGKGPNSVHVQWTAGKVDELLSQLHPSDKALVLERLGLSQLDAGTIDPPPEISKKKSETRTNEALADERVKR